MITVRAAATKCTEPFLSNRSGSGRSWAVQPVFLCVIAFCTVTLALVHVHFCNYYFVTCTLPLKKCTHSLTLPMFQIPIKRPLLHRHI